MKKLVLLMFLVLGVFISCRQVSDGKNKLYFEMFEENPVTINWQKDNDIELKSFQADVSIYSMNNRTDTSSQLKNKYRMSLKTIDEVQYSRLDFLPEFGNGVAQSVVTDDTEMILFDTVTNEIEYRLPIQETMSADLAFLGMETALSKINLDFVKSESNRLLLDVTENEKNSMMIDIPNTYFFDNEYETRVSTRVMFDTEEETLSQVEIVMIQQDGTIVTTTTYPMYQDYEGVPIRIGTVTVVNSKAQNLLSGFEDAEYFESVDEIPEISDEEYEQLLESGELVEVDNMLFGNPADMSYEETIIEVYNDIEINNVDESLFKIALDKKKKF